MALLVLAAPGRPPSGRPDSAGVGDILLTRVFGHAVVVALVLSVPLTAALAPSPALGATVNAVAARGAGLTAAPQSGTPTIIPAPPAEACPSAAVPVIASDQPYEQQLAQAQAAEREILAALADCDARIERLNERMADLIRQTSAAQTAVAGERHELAVLARGVYRQSDSILVAFLAAGNLGDFLTNMSDLNGAGRRAEDVQRRLKANLDHLTGVEASVAAAAAQQVTVRATIAQTSAALTETENRIQQAQAEAVAAALAAQVPPPAPIVPVAPAYASGQIADLIREAFGPLGTGAVDWALRVAHCESTYNPLAVNPYSGTEGLFQFMPSTWRETPYASSSPFDARANALAAAWLYQHSGPNQWECR